MKRLGPLHLKPLLKQIRWGGTRLGTELGKPIGNWTDAAESWEVVDHGADQSLVTQGPGSGNSLAELVEESGSELFGEHPVSQFPLLIKFLDATDRLSLQVHPDDEQAITYDPTENGKTEAWVILDTTPESQIWLGLKEGVQREDLRQALQNQQIEAVTHSVIPKPGDCFFVPAGTVHAIGEGILLAEVQQSSDLTFRLHDWGRVGADGHPREIHVEQSLNCTDYERGPLNATKPTILSDGPHKIEELVSCPYFRIQRHSSADPCLIQTENRFRIVMLLEGQLRYTAEEFQGELTKGDTILLPAVCPDVEVSPGTSSIWLEIDQP